VLKSPATRPGRAGVTGCATMADRSETDGRAACQGLVGLCERKLPVSLRCAFWGKSL